ncbi:MAG TPA: DinB family protein [Blastocatellia bacterium]|nr:DinB family protein [Blastocatellia bacterium]
MAQRVIARPGADEYASYYGGYIKLAPDGDILEGLARQIDETLALLRGLSEARAASRYAADKWSIKEVSGHMIDAERIFAYRALRFARGDAQPLAGFEQDDYIRHANFDSRSISDLAEEFEHVRRANILLFRNLDGEAWSRRGTASGAEVTVRALIYIIAGHERHHVGVIRDRYL